MTSQSNNGTDNSGSTRYQRGIQAYASQFRMELPVVRPRCGARQARHSRSLLRFPRSAARPGSVHSAVSKAGQAGNHAEFAGLEVAEGVGYLSLGIHDERPAEGDRFPDRLAAVDHDDAGRTAVGGL